MRRAFLVRDRSREQPIKRFVRYLAANTHPDHDTVARFRRENSSLIRSTFVQLLHLAKTSGLLRLGTVALDGTKMGAAAAKRRNRSYEQLQAEIGELNTQVEDLLKRATAADQANGDDERLPAELTKAQERRARLLAAKTELEQQALTRHQQREKQRRKAPPGGKRPRLDSQPRKDDRINLSDPDSALTRTRSGFIQGYNAQCITSVERVSLLRRMYQRHE